MSTPLRLGTRGSTLALAQLARRADRRAGSVAGHPAHTDLQTNYVG